MISCAQIRSLRLRAQGLDPAFTQPANPEQIVALLGGVQAQEADSALLAVGIRDRGLVAAQIEDARQTERTIVRTWGFRGTLHLLATSDLGWLLALLGPLFIRASQRRYAQLGLSEERYTSAVRLIETVLSGHGPLTRSELAEQLTKGGTPLEGQAIYHTLRRAGLEGIVCLGPDQDGEPTYVLLHDWVHVGKPHEENEALATLARRYLSAYGPAGPEDLASCSGLSMRQSRAGFEQITRELMSVEVRGSETWMLHSHREWLEQPVDEKGVIRLLPGYDPYLLGYRDRSLIVSPQLARRIHPGGGLIRPTVIQDGRAVGVWRPRRGGGRIEIVVELFAALSDQAIEALDGETRALARFYAQETALIIAGGAGQDG